MHAQETSQSNINEDVTMLDTNSFLNKVYDKKSNSIRT